MARHVLRSEIVPSAVPSEQSPREVGRELRDLLDEGWKLAPAGAAKSDPAGLLSGGYAPKYKFQLFDTRYYLGRLRDDENFRFFVAFVMRETAKGAQRRITPRLFYKDQSLIWRCATHYMRSQSENWIGKGDLRFGVVDGEELEYTAEETTDLPYEVQHAMDLVARRSGSPKRDLRAVPLILRHAPDDRFEPYDDFLAPRRRAAANPSNRIHGGRLVAWFERSLDPRSLRFAKGFEPDFGKRGVLEVAKSKSRLYDGVIRRYRILSRNRQIQYMFVESPKMVWIIPPQALTTEIMSYGVRTLDVRVDEDLCVPGYEYHFVDDSGDSPVLYSQIPKGFAGPASKIDPSRASASPWLEQLPVIRDFRRKVLGQR